MRAVLRREHPLEHHGEHYDIPYSGPGATGLGKPLKLITRPLRADIPIYLAAIGPRNVALAAEIADGWLPILFSPERSVDVHARNLEEGFARAERGPRRSTSLRWCRSSWATTWGLPGLPQAGARPVRGRHGRTRPELLQPARLRYGYEAEAAAIQNLYLDGKKAEAAAAVPDALVDEIALVGDRARIADRLDAWRECGATSLLLQARQPEALRLLAELVT